MSEIEEYAKRWTEKFVEASQRFADGIMPQRTRRERTEGSMPALKNAKRKGNRNEHKSMARHAAQGAHCIRAGGSLGLFDFVALYPGRALLVQVKSNRWPGRTETEALVQFICPLYAHKVIERWDDYAREPRIKELPHGRSDACPDLAT